MSQRGKITLLLFFFCVCATASLMHYYAEQRPERMRPSELYDVVRRQLAACRANNYPSAYDQVSSRLQPRGSLDPFSGTVQSGDTRILQAERVEFGLWQRRGRHATVEVFFVNRDGTVLPCIYSLVSEGEGWKIDGARWVKGWPAGQRMRGVRS